MFRSLRLKVLYSDGVDQKKYGELHYTGTRFAIRLEMKNGKQKVIGTGKPEELNRILSTIAGEKYSNPTGYEFDYS